jgi:hypothetical protein
MAEEEKTVRRNVVIRESLDERFRKTIAVRDGLGRGNLSAALEEAIELWLKVNEPHSGRVKGKLA